MGLSPIEDAAARSRRGERPATDSSRLLPHRSRLPVVCVAVRTALEDFTRKITMDDSRSLSENVGPRNRRVAVCSRRRALPRKARRFLGRYKLSSRFPGHEAAASAASFWLA